MRILTFLHSFEPGGVERVALRLVRQWRTIGVDAPLFVGRAEGALQAELAQDLPFITTPAVIRTKRFETLRMVRQLPAVIRELRPDVLFCAGNTYTVVVVLMKLLLGDECPPIVTKVSNDLVLAGLPSVLVPLYKGWAWLQSRLIDNWVVMHPAMRDEVCTFADGADVTIIPDPALTRSQVQQLQAWRPAPRSGRRFVAIGRLVPQKNYPLMLRAFAAETGETDTITIFGDGHLRRSLRRLADRLCLGDRVTFAGHVEDAWQYLLGQDVLLLSSAYEGIPAVLVEAMTCGMPIIATDCGAGVRGLLQHYPNAILCTAGNVESFGRAIRTLPACGEQRGSVPFDAEAYTIEAGALRYLDAFAAAASGDALAIAPNPRPVQQPLLLRAAPIGRTELDRAGAANQD